MPKSSWFYRRSLTFIVVAYCMASNTWAMWYGIDDELRRLIAQGNIWLLFGVLAIYIGGATMDDIITVVRSVRGMPDKQEAK